jgi:hypothetical protein
VEHPAKPGITYPEFKSQILKVDLPADAVSHQNFGHVNERFHFFADEFFRLESNASGCLSRCGVLSP